MSTSQRIALLCKQCSYVLFVFLITLSTVFTWPGKVNAATNPNYNKYCNFSEAGRHGCHGYFTGQNMFGATSTYIYGDNVLLPPGSADALAGVDSAATFIAVVEGYLHEGSPSRYTWNSAGAAFIIDTMLGEPGGSLCGGGSCDWGDGIRYAENNLDTWKTRVTNYDANHLVNWGVNPSNFTFMP